MTNYFLEEIDKKKNCLFSLDLFDPRLFWVNFFLNQPTKQKTIYS